MGGAVVTANVEGVGGVQQAKFWAHSTRKIQAETMHSKLCLLHTANHVFFDRYYISLTGMAGEMTTVKADIEPILDR